MAAPDPQTLYDFEDQFETATVAALTAGLTALGIDPTKVQFKTSRDADIKDTPRVEVSFSLTAAMQQRTTLGQATPKATPNAFEGIIACLLVTTRPVATDNADLHGPLVGAIRYIMSAGGKAFNGTNLPYLQILQMLPENQSPRVQNDKEQDLTGLNFHVWFAIQNSAWPVTP